MMVGEFLDRYGVEKKLSKVFSFVLYCVFSSLLCLFVYLAIFYPVDFLVTEKFLIAERIPQIISSIFLLIIVAVITLVNWKKLVKSFFTGALIALLAVVIFFGNRFYLQKKSRSEIGPKIFQIDPKAGLHGQFVSITGKNFISEGKVGKVFLGKDKMIILIWEDDRILFEQPFLDRFGPEKLYLVRSDGVESNKINYYVKNPGE